MNLGLWNHGQVIDPSWWVPKDGRTLDLDALNWRMWDAENGARAPNALTVSRPSERRRVGPSGLIETVGSGLIARDFTVAGAARALQIEPQTTNLALRSGDLAHAAWGKGGATVAVGALAPDGVQTFGRITEGAAAGQHYVFQDVGTLVVGDVLTITAFVKATGIGSARHVFLTAHGEGSGVFNPSTGAIVSSSGVTSSVEAWTTGVYRVRASITKTNTTGNIYIGLWNPAGNNSYTGDGVSCVDVWGVQVEKRSTPTSYMPTVASTAVRYADNISTAWGTWGSQAAGSFRAVYTAPYATAPAGDVLSVANADGSAQMILRARTGAANIAWFVTSSGVEVGRIEAGAAVSGQREVLACSYGPAGFKISRNGGAVATNGTLSPIASPASLLIGRQFFDGNQLGGWMERLSFKPSQLSNSDLQAWAAAA